jgi:sterol 24-C-methyltransferase
METGAILSYEEAKTRAFESLLHRQSSKTESPVSAILQKDSNFHEAASKNYFKYWDNRTAEDETDSIRQARVQNYATMTRQ